MIYYLLPNAAPNIYKQLNCDYNENVCLNPSLSCYLQQIKLKINKYEREWDIYKKYTNPYEYINTICNSFNLCVSQYKPLSRSFFKMLEIIHVFELIQKQEPICTFHLAEGPGGFIEAVVRERNNKDDSYVGMTLIDNNNNDPNIPSWKKSELFLKKNKNVYIESGEDGTGDLLNIVNFDHVVAKYKNTMDLITADGGFDFSTDFNNQENTIFKLLMAQVCYALCTQKQGGVFVLKLFDCFLPNTVDLIYLLSSCYKKVYITKPQTSRYANSEKYLVCKDFHTSITVSYIRTALIQVINNSTNTSKIFPFLLPNYFTSKLEEYNAIFGQQQLENINSTIRYIESKTKGEKIDSLIQINISKCTKWCIKHNVEYNVFQKHNCFI